MTRPRFSPSLPALLLLGLAGCTATPAPPTNDTSASLAQREQKDTGAFKDLDPWVLKTTDPDANRGNHGIYLASGYLSLLAGPDGGTAKAPNRYAKDTYNAQEAIQGSDWVALSGPKLIPGQPYEQSLDLKRGVLTTRSGETTVTTFVSAAEPILAVRQVQGQTPEGKMDPKAPPYASILRYAPTNSPYFTLAKKPLPDVPTALAAHEAAWAKRWEGRDIIIDGDPEAQQLVHKLMFDLIQSVRPDGSYSIAPEALSGDFYKGHIFWDAEVWMFPALLAQHPDLAKTMLEYRFAHLEQAKAQAAKQGCKGADFPWESAVSGNETAPGGFSEGRHVTAGIGWATWQYWRATGDKAWLSSRGWPLLSNIANYFATKVKKNTTGGYDLGPLTGPDEAHMKVTNNAYTNAMAINCLNAATDAAKALGKPANPLWAMVAKGLVLPKNADGVILRCIGDDGKPGTKQADGELLLWPAQAPGADAKTFDFHKGRPIKNGPAMTDSVHALISARLGRADEAEKEFRESYRPFVRGPFLLFSEKRSMDRCVFTTGCGGVLQAVLYGFGGLDFAHWEAITKAPIALPKSWKKLEIQGIQYQGKRYTLTVTQEKRTLTPQQ